MTPKDITQGRLANQKIEGSEYVKPEDTVSWMGAMQAQDLAMAKWAVGLRTNGTTLEDIERALDEAKIIRTHILRPTWHFVSGSDIHWMIELSAPHIKASQVSRHRQLELTNKTLSKCFKIIERELENGQHLTRPELKAKLLKARIDTNENRSAHIMFMAELEGLVGSGKMKGKQTTYALLEERVKKPRSITRDEARLKLARKYFASHGPATIADYAWWSGLPMKDVRESLEEIKGELASVVIGGQTYWYVDAPNVGTGGVHPLPSFDEYLISYKERSAALDLKHQPKAFTNNGIFYPVIVVNRKVCGTWKRKMVLDTVAVEANIFQKISRKNERELSVLAEEYCKFMGGSVTALTVKNIQD
mgnify:CR=1 FL=1